MTTYAEGFDAAFERTKSSEFAPGSFEPSKEPIEITIEQRQRLLTGLRGVLAVDGVRSEKEMVNGVSQRCAPVSRGMRGMVENILGYPVMLTIGDVVVDGVPLFGARIDSSFQDLARTGHYHIWFTTPSMNVIDLTLESALVAGRKRKYKGLAVYSGDPECASDRSWLPMYVGLAATNYLVDEGIRVSLASPFLA